MDITDGKYRYEIKCETCGEIISEEYACACGIVALPLAESKPLRGLPKNKYHNIVEDFNNEEGLP